MKISQLILHYFRTYRRGKVVGYRKAERFYINQRERLQYDWQTRYDTIETQKRLALQKKDWQTEEYIKQFSREYDIRHKEEIREMREEITILKKRISDCQRGYEIFVDDLHDFATIVSGQSGDAHIVQMKGAELFQAIQRIGSKSRSMADRISKKDERIRKLLYTREEGSGQ